MNTSGCGWFRVDSGFQVGDPHLCPGLISDSEPNLAKVASTSAGGMASRACWARTALKQNRENAVVEGLLAPPAASDPPFCPPELDFCKVFCSTVKPESVERRTPAEKHRCPRSWGGQP